MKRKSIASASKAKGKGKLVGEETVEYDKSRFVTPAAYERFSDGSKNPKGFIDERGFNFGDTLLQHVSTVIRDLGWQKFVEEPNNAAVVPIVREFYANVPEHRHGRIRIRGIEVSFGAKTINAHYGLPNHEALSYSQFVEQIDYDELLRTVCEEGAEWVMSNGLHSSFKGEHLTYIGRLWQYFICSRLIPTVHHSEVTRDRAQMMFAIMKRQKINVGELIYERILHCSRTKRVAYFFPQLITALCAQAGVRFTDDEELRQPGKPLTLQFMDKVMQAGKKRSAIPKTSTKTGSSSQTTRGPMRQMASELQSLREGQQFLMERQQEQQTWMNGQMQFMSHYMQSLRDLQMLQISHFGLDGSQVQFPEYPGDLTLRQFQQEGDRGDDESEADEDDD